MTKKRYLRTDVEKVLTVITILLIMFFGMLDNFKIIALPVILILLTILVLNIYVLYKYGKGVWMDHDTEKEIG